VYLDIGVSRIGVLAKIATLATVVALLGIGASASEAQRTVAGLQVVARGLAEPVALAFAPGSDSRLYVAERRGTVRVVDEGRLSGSFLDIRSRITRVGRHNERGFLGLAFNPSFPDNGRSYVSYTTASGDVRVAEMVYRAGRIERGKERVLLDVSQKPFHLWHFAGALQFGEAGKLLVSTGDGGYWRQALPNAAKARPLEADPYGNSQNPSIPNAKLLEIDVDAATPAWSAVAIGLRNPWRVSVDRTTGDVWIGDVGFSRVEEVDVIRAGDPLLNFGWSVYEGRARRNYRGTPPTLNPGGRLTWPYATYDHRHGDCAIIGGYVYRGSAIAALVGRYVFGDYCSGRVWSIASTGASGRPRLEPFKVPHLTSFAEDSAGELYASSGDGTVVELVAH
jgi:glucose/arabinose dehydrogenase